MKLSSLYAIIFLCALAAPAYSAENSTQTTDVKVDAKASQPKVTGSQTVSVDAGQKDKNDKSSATAGATTTIAAPVPAAVVPVSPTVAPKTEVKTIDTTTKATAPLPVAVPVPVKPSDLTVKASEATTVEKKAEVPSKDNQVKTK